MKQTLFLKQLATYFETYLPQNRKCSKNTIVAYADGFVAFFQFFQEKKGKAHYLIDYEDLTPQVFDEYVLWMQAERGYSPASQKQRMSALSALNAAAGAQIPKVPDVHFPHFSVEEIKILLRIPKQTGKSGIRDTVLLSLLYDSGARAQEICDLCIGDITLGKTCKIKLHGKGNKTREVPISADVAKLIRKYMSDRGMNFKDNRNEALFPSQRSDRITTACIRNLVSKYVGIAKEEHPALFVAGNYSPHCFRHSKAIHMLEAGVPLIYIRNFLGHESVNTTEVYARVSQEAVTKVLQERNIPNPIPETEKSKKSCDSKIPDFLKNVK